MRIGRLWLIPALCALMFACAQEQPVSESSVAVPATSEIQSAGGEIERKAVPTATPVSATAEIQVVYATPVATPAMGARDEVEQKAVPAATSDLQRAREQLSSFGGSIQGFLNPHPGQSSLEEIILESDVIVRADYLRRAHSVENINEGQWWVALLEFRFEVHEYLKGSGSDEIGAVAFYYYDTEVAARQAAPLLAAAHDARWDGREAIVFLNYIAEHVAPQQVQLGAGQFWLAPLDNGDGFVDRYSVASDATKLWLPEASQSGSGTRAPSDSGKSSTPQRFMLDVPSGSGGGSGGARSAGGPTISLSDLKSRITALEAEANAGGTPEYRTCVEAYYRDSRRTQERIANRGGRRVMSDHSFSMDSGLPAGTVMQKYPHYPPSTSDRFEPRWYEGPDKDLMAFDYVSFDDHSALLLVTARPLPAGTYTFYPNWLWPESQLCNKDWSYRYNQVGKTLNVTTPATVRVLHEAFFDPVDIGDAVGADGTNGVLKPAAFSLNGATTTISSLKWENGAVSMTLSPTASLADYAIDFIDVNGTTTLSLTSDNASTTPLTWTVPDKPWSDGDLLMLRMRRFVSSDATLNGLTLTSIDLTFDPATTTYTTDVPATTTQTTVTPTANHGSATYVVKLAGVVDNDGTIDLAVGENVITVDVTAEDTTNNNTYTVTVTRAVPSEPITVTLTPRVDGSNTYVNITIEWNDPQTCDGRYLVALYTSADYLVQFLGFRTASETASLSTQSGTDWALRFFPDWFAGVSCHPSELSAQTRDLGRVSLRAAHPDSN